MAGLDIDFEVKVLEGIDESYPEGIAAEEVPLYISKAKALAYRGVIADDQLVVTADTVVVLGDKVLGKPANRQEAVDMLHDLSGKTHRVVTAACLTTTSRQRCLSVVSEVTFKQLADWEIDYYVDHYRPYDKAGAYGIQEWIGHVGVTALKGSYFNVMGLPVQRIYQELIDMEGPEIVIRDGRARP